MRCKQLKRGILRLEHPSLCLTKMLLFAYDNITTYIWIMQIENRIKSSIQILAKEKVKYNTFPKWVRIADICLTSVYLLTYITALILLVRWLIKL